MSRYGLTEAEREDLENSLRWHFEAYAEDPKSGYASAGVLTALGKVARIVTERQADAWDEGFKEGEEYAESWHMPTTPHKEPNPYRATEETS